jgi:hypothetical protein
MPPPLELGWLDSLSTLASLPRIKPGTDLIALLEDLGQRYGC